MGADDPLETSSLMNDKNLSKIQVISGGIFGSFLGLHLLNSLSAVAGEAIYNDLMNLFRKYYQRQFVEPVILGAAAVHMVVSGIKIYRRWKRGSQVGDNGTVSKQSQTKEDQATTSSWYHNLTPLQLHRYSGYFLTAVIVGHVAAVRLPYFVNGHLVDMSFVSFSIDNWPYIFYPYYIMFSALGLYHMTYGTIQGMKIIVGKNPTWLSPRNMAFKLFVGIGAATLMAGVLSIPLYASKTRYPLWRIEYAQFFPESFLPWKNPWLAQFARTAAV